MKEKLELEIYFEVQVYILASQHHVEGISPNSDLKHRYKVLWKLNEHHSVSVVWFEGATQRDHYRALAREYYPADN